MTVTGEGTQPLSDLAWKKKENKYMGDKSMSTKEQHIEKELEKKSQTEKYLLNFPPEEKYLGFENDSNICYANSAMQVLYHCRAFREQVVNWKPCNTQKYYLINELADLFKAIKSAKGTRGIVNHRRMIARIRAGNALFNNEEHHDSHEFL